jgi:hypothetical protein
MLWRGHARRKWRNTIWRYDKQKRGHKGEEALCSCPSKQGNENSAVQRKQSTNFDMDFSGWRRKNKHFMQECRDLQAVSFVPVCNLSVPRHDEDIVVEWRKDTREGSVEVLLL